MRKTERSLFGSVVVTLVLTVLALPVLSVQAAGGSKTAKPTPVPAAPSPATPAPAVPVNPPAPRAVLNGAPGAQSAVVQDNAIVDEQTELLIHGALKYLTAQQKPNGSWSISGNHNIAITSYVLVAFMSAGNVPDEGEFGKPVQRGVQYLMDHVGADGYISDGPSSNMYGHGVSTIALAEAYGQTKDPNIRAKVELAIKLITSCQNREGGWRYRPRIADADISISVLQCVALRAAKNAGIEVPQESLDRAVSFIKSCYDPKTGGFGYKPDGPAGFARTAAGIYSLQVCGLYNDPMVKSGCDYILGEETKPGKQYITYGTFYAGPAMYMIGGDHWAKWYDSEKSKLIKSVKRDGELACWEPVDGMLGTIYATAVDTTILAIPYHYMPLYQR